MQLTRSEENKNRIISGTVTLVIFLLMLLFFIWVKLISPNPPFPEASSSSSQQLALAMFDTHNNATSPRSVVNSKPLVEERNEKEQIAVVKNGKAVPINDPNPKIQNTTPFTYAVKDFIPPSEKTELNEITKNYIKNTGLNKESTSPYTLNENPFMPGTEKNGIPSDKNNARIDGADMKRTSYGVDLIGRVVIKSPVLPKDIKEEGTVVVEITVDQQGNVIEANPNGRGTTTSSALLKAKAKQTALATKFDIDSKPREQKGTITLIFLFN